MATKEQTDQGAPEELTSNSAIQWVESLSDTKFAYLMLTPAFILLAIIAFYPIVSTFNISMHADVVQGSQQVGGFVGFKNYVALLTGQLDTVALPVPFFDLSQPFHSALIVTVIFTVVSVFFETVIGFGQALVLDQDFRGRRWVRVAIILPWAVPLVIQGMMFYLIFTPGIGFGVGVVKMLGFSGTPLQNSTEAIWLVIIADVWKSSAFMALLILAGLQSIDRGLYEVAKVAGATRWQQFKMITFPLVLPTVAVAVLFRALGAAKIYGLIATMSSCTTVPSMSCLVVTTFSTRRYGTAAAIAFVMAAIIAIVVTIYLIRSSGGDREAVV